MNRFLITTFFLLQALSALATDWKKIEVSNILSFEFPKDYKVTDSAGLKIYSAEGTSASFQCIIYKTTFKGSTVEELDQFYFGFLAGFARKIFPFRLDSSNYFYLNNYELRALRSRFQKRILNSKYPEITDYHEQDMENLTIYTKNYLFNFCVIVPRGKETDFDSFVNTIKFNAIKSDQLKPPTKGLPPETIGQIVAIFITFLALYYGLKSSK